MARVTRRKVERASRGGRAEDARMAELLERARLAGAGAYAPYSGFHVGAALLTKRGGVFVGVNVENASYGLTLCAERAALAAAVAAEGRGMRVECLAVVVDAGRIFMPCGACRQVLAEFAEAGVPVWCAAREGRPAITSVGALLPDAFAL